MEHLLGCMNCSSIWSPGTEEYEEQICSACGWRPGRGIMVLSVGDDFDDDDFDDADDIFPDCGNDDEENIDEANDGFNL